MTRSIQPLTEDEPTKFESMSLTLKAHKVQGVFRFATDDPDTVSHGEERLNGTDVDAIDFLSS